MNSKDIQLNRKRKNNDSNEVIDKKARHEVESSLWVEKYRPLTTRAVIGQQGDKSCVNKLLKWLTNWYQNLDKKPTFGKFGGSDDGQGFRAALLSGPPGVGKTTSAQLVCKELGFDYIELNASDARNKKSLDVVVKELLHNTTLTNYFNGMASNGVTHKHVLIMDEVDGMSGNEDRGGVAELIQLIKNTKVPLICICNDRSHPKMRSLVGYCFDLRFFRPRVEQIKGPMMSIAYKEGIQLAPNVLHELIVSSNQDIRQVLHNLSLLGTGTKQIKNLMSEQSIKDVRLGPFEAVRKVFTAGEEYSRMSFGDKSDLFFCDYSIMPLFNFENYIHVKPTRAKSEVQKLKLATKAIDSMILGDLVEKQIRSTNNWSLLPLQAAFASVMPGAYMNGHLGAQIQFPSFMGKLSTTNKRNRLLQELKMHMNLKVSGSKTALNLDYLEPLRDAIIEPLVQNGTGGVPQSIEILKNYSLRREDIESITELTLWNNQKDPMTRVDSKTKAALTRAYNKDTFCLPYSLGTIVKGKKGKATTDMDELGEDGEPINEDMAAEDNEEDNDDIASDAMIKAKKKTVKKGSEKESKAKTKANKSKKSEIESEDKKKPKKEPKTESKKESKTEPKKESKTEPKKEPKTEPKKEPKSEPKKEGKSEKKKETKTELKSEPKVIISPKKSSKISPKKEVLIETKSDRNKRSPKKLDKIEPKVETNSEQKKTVKKTPKKEPKSKSEVKETPNERKSKSKDELKSDEKKSKKSEDKSKASKANSASKGKQLTISSFFIKK